MREWISYIALIVACLPVAAIFTYRLMLVLAMRFETRHTRTFVPPAAGSSSTPRPYFIAMNEQAGQLGFVGGEIRVHSKSKTFDFHSSTWLSPERTILASVTSGTGLGVAQDVTVLISRTATGTLVVSNDEFGKVELRQIGQVRTLWNADFRELLKFHVRRLAERNAVRLPFEESDGWTALHAIEDNRVGGLVESGQAEFIDPARMTWRYTWRGSIASLPKMPKEEIKQQIDRAKIARPGHRDFVPSCNRCPIGG